MNERFKEILHQCSVPDEKAENYAQSLGMVIPEHKLDVAKFAEMIVRSCALVAGLMEYQGRKNIGAAILDSFGVPDDSIKVGSRVKVISGFNVGAKGTVSYIEPTGRLWVMRDGASTDVFYTADEVVGVES